MAKAKKTAALDLALQGGGSHGAFTWGVLDRLLEDESLPIEGLSGTSAGALNAAVLATGWAEGGREGARAALRAFWHDVAGALGCFGDTGVDPWRDAWRSWAALNPVFQPLVDALPLGTYNLDLNPTYLWFSQLSKSLSPYQFNPLGQNPLREVLARHVRESAIRRGPLRLFVTATAVRSGQPRIFESGDLSIDALLASACLPQLFKAVTIAGQPYWDGGYSGNPALWPLIYRTRSTDILLVKINPLVRPGTPDTASEITDRVNEITFNAGLVAEMRAIHFVERLLRDKHLDPKRYKALRLHMVADDEGLAPLQPSSKLNTDLGFLQRLHAHGRTACATWLATHRSAIGRHGTLDVEKTFLEPR